MKRRITCHPILPTQETEEILFYWKDQPYSAQAGETISAALIANDIKIFGHHHLDQTPQSIYCANGQCAQCMVIANGKPIKSCMALIQPGMKIFPAEGLPILPPVHEKPALNEIQEIHIPVLIIGGGPAGLSAAIELGKFGIETILMDDKHRLGGKLVLQTHRFFGSAAAAYAGTRGIDIATKLEEEIARYPSIQIWLKSTALAVYSDGLIGVLHENEYVHVKTDTLLIATGAREKFIAFQGNSLPGVFGAGAFQTLVNRDLVKPAQKIFIIGGGNVGLIAGYHALQAGISVVGLVEALPDCGGYKVHKDKLARLGVPIYTSHTILSANGTDQVESVTIAQIDDHFQPIQGTEKSFACDCILTAVGLSPLNEFYEKAIDFGIPSFIAGDAEEIAEASAAIFSGKIKGLEIAQSMGINQAQIPQEWHLLSQVLKSKPGEILNETESTLREGVLPVLHCVQEIPCDPCTSLCPKNLIVIDPADIRKPPTFIGSHSDCIACERCVSGCPGLAITLVDYRKDVAKPTVSIPYEFNQKLIQINDYVTCLDREGAVLGECQVLDLKSYKNRDHTSILHLQAPAQIANQIAGVRLQNPEVTQEIKIKADPIPNDTIICRCERVTAGEIRSLIRNGCRDLNEIKTVSRAGMGACGGKTCPDLIQRLFKEEGISLSEVVNLQKRPLFIEVSLGKFAGIMDKEA